MKPGDLVRLIPDEDDEPDRYDGLVGMILAEAGHQLGDPLFRLLVNGKTGWRMPEDRLELISGAG